RPARWRPAAPARSGCRSARSAWRSSTSEVVSRIAEVERLVDQREVGNDVADHRVLDHRPVLPRRVVAVATAYAAAGIELERDEGLAAPALDPAGPDRRPRGQDDVAAHRSRRQPGA